VDEQTCVRCQCHVAVARADELSEPKVVGYEKADFLAQRMEMIVCKAMSRVVPRLALAAVICALTAVILSKAEAAGNTAAGERVFGRCVVCHSPKAGENRTGPSLAGVFGRKSGSAPGYNYSPALKSAGITWDEQELDKYLANPRAYIPGTRKVTGVPNAEDRQNVIAYLKTLK
jgi:cytochrome c